VGTNDEGETLDTPIRAVENFEGYLDIDRLLPNKGSHLTAYSLRSYVAPASSRASTVTLCEKRNDHRITHVEIRFSRHAKRRADLYGIPQSIMLTILKEKELPPGTHEIIQTVEGFKYPLKLVVAVENDIITVITNHLLKKGLKP